MKVVGILPGLTASWDVVGAKGKAPAPRLTLSGMALNAKEAVTVHLNFDGREPITALREACDAALAQEGTVGS